MPTRIGVLSDTHLNRVTEDLAKIYDKYLADMDLILHAWDFVSPEIVEFFLARKDFHGVCGNMDPIDVREMLPEKKVLELGSFRIGLMHGWGSSQGLEMRLRPEFHNVDVIVYGHSHTPLNQIDNGILFFNPGTAAGYTLTQAHSIGILEISDTIEGRIIEI